MLHRNSISILICLIILLMIGSCSHKSPGLNFYQKHISPIDGDRCSSYPSCSHYANDAIKKHGIILGWIMASDRLLRCGRDTSTLSKKIVIDSKVFIYDSVESNDFWWYDKKDN